MQRGAAAGHGLHAQGQGIACTASPSPAFSALNAGVASIRARHWQQPAREWLQCWSLTS
ncbi:hypothetical protein XAC3810_830034 [Xanthomonas citri pv. citri]|uniref:Uncharacterized protein n=1 Tax=Xanthomonas citri pv. citri TaxID=611301 RepID=A0A0U5FKU2_XANCI|nr:hypothetical protein XAC902_1160034 [Xanthomonas citri pv. citri]CEE25128.1 hypothetical protein XAC908_1180015 [Xanthomonas citri pv. citri]CEE42272.1 hypothetical protein XAC3824_990033 [Xanthomonas citri pv. citri]CEE43469.1 hypothetical protein XAC9322_800034 [Xanthomonas citri pv. citri]CEE44204.1 hypothetical protein XAC1083_840033 [Xanthomonas citri pv. citri]